MTIEMYIQGDSSKSDEKMFGFLGGRLLDRKIHEKLGVAITSDSGDFWWVARNGGKFLGFLTAKILKNKSMHIRFLYTEETGEKNAKALMKCAIEYAKEQECLCVYTNEREDSKLLPSLKFESTPRARGSFCRWEKNIEVKK